MTLTRIEGEDGRSLCPTTSLPGQWGAADPLCEYSSTTHEDFYVTARAAIGFARASFTTMLGCRLLADACGSSREE